MEDTSPRWAEQVINFLSKFGLNLALAVFSSMVTLTLFGSTLKIQPVDISNWLTVNVVTILVALSLVVLAFMFFEFVVNSIKSKKKETATATADNDTEPLKTVAKVQQQKPVSKAVATALEDY